MGWEDKLSKCEALEWDGGSLRKVWERHGVAPTDCEEVFFNRPLIVGEDEKESEREGRFYALGQTDAGGRLFVVFTLPGHTIRVISAREMSRKGANALSRVMKKPIPQFKSENAEREFWANHDSAEFIDWSKGKRATLPNLKPSSQTISLRLPRPMLARLKLLANKRDVPYQSLLKVFVAERLKRELELPNQEPERR
jgi:uncharacterized DUF497 family protein/predicted DNA binding CopG/RHH family protein